LPKDKTALTGQPIRRDVLHGSPEGAFDFFKLDSTIPTLLILGGSQGADIINNTIIEILPELLTRYQVIHQTGPKNLDDSVLRANLLLEKSQFKNRYVATAYLNNLATRMAAGAATLIVSRAGSAIFEIASWGVPSIIIPITNSNGDHQRKNAFNYARTGACVVMEENNFSSHVLLAEIDKLTNNKELLEQMKKSALAFASPTAAEKIAQAALDITLSHEK
jgi:UDP-N-acetylglucosamine--N-acetylmuramyl-(pentapeptide) pyrophosphoryl-undecaprenol N-acetylglucosamine transferase